MRREILAGYVLATWGLGIGVWLPVRGAQADEGAPATHCPTCPDEAGAPILAKVPYLNRLFKNHAGEAELVGRHGRIECRIALAAHKEHDEATQACQAASSACCPKAHAECRPAKTAEELMKEITLPVTVQELLDLVNEQWASQLDNYESKLQLAQELNDERTEMLADVAELLAAKAKLEAKVEYLSEREEWQREMRQLAVENERLHAELALAAKGEEMLQETLRLMEENAQLRLELARSGKGAAAQTAKRQPQSKRSR